MVDSITELVRPGQLQRRLAHAFPRGASRLLLVGFATQGERTYASLGADRGNESRQPIPLGCLAKLFLGRVARESAVHGSFHLHENVARFLPSQHAQLLAGTTFQHLLEHTHGLDESGELCVPFMPDRALDLPAVIQCLKRVAPPGLIYSYGSAGAWLACAALEAIFGHCYPMLLCRSLRSTRDMSDTLTHVEQLLAQGGIICPAGGGAMKATAADLMTFLGSECRGEIGSQLRLAQAAGRITSLPGWAPVERGVCLGWKYFGRGWFGHNSILPGSMSLVRMHPERQITLLIHSEGMMPNSIMSAVFKTLLPDLVMSPAMLRPKSAAPGDPTRFCGSYGNDALRVEITTRADALVLSAFAKRASGFEEIPRIDVELRPVEESLFVPSSPASHRFPFVQFVRPPGSARRFLWNGTVALAERTADN